MAVRIHVAAARGVSPEQFRQAFEDHFGERFGDVELEGANGWVWFIGSVWAVGGGELDEVLRRLPGTSLRVTTEDACRWYLLLHAPDRESYVLCHEFWNLGPGDESEGSPDAEYEKWVAQVGFLFDEESANLTLPPRPAEDLIDDCQDLGVGLPEELARRVADLTLPEARREVMQHFARATADALKAFGIPHDRSEVVSVLTERDEDEAAHWGDIGNLPAFLRSIGFAGSWAHTPDVENDVDEEEPEPVDEEARAREAIEKALSRIAEVVPEPVAGGPVALPLERATDVQAIAWFCGEYTDVVAEADLPEGAEIEPVDVHPRYAAVVRTESGLAAYTSWGRPLAADRDWGAISRVLEPLPDGTHLRISTSSDPEDDEAKAAAALQIYEGPVVGGGWRIEAAWPPVSAETLGAALGLVTELRRGEGHEVDDEEATVILEAAGRHPMVTGNHVGHREGRVWTDEEWVRPYLALLLFRHRFADTWDVDAWAREDDEEADWWDELGAMEQTPKLHEDELLHEGRHARFYVGLAAMLPEESRAVLADADRSMAGIGFEPLGDLVASAAQGVLIRGYAGHDGRAYGVAMHAVDGQAYTEFYTRFADGSSLTTSTNHGAETRPDTGIFMRVYEDRTPTELLAKHADGIARFREHRGASPVPHAADLPALAEAIDEFLGRHEAGNQGFRTVTITL